MGSNCSFINKDIYKKEYYPFENSNKNICYNRDYYEDEDYYNNCCDDFICHC